MKRSTFLNSGVVSMISPILGINRMNQIDRSQKITIISTWKHGETANRAALLVLDKNGTALDAAEAGCRAVEEDPEITSVGYGGLPDISGDVTLDACIMDWKGNAGSVAFMKNIMYPASVARKVMENTNHVMLAGDGAFRFAIKNGFKKVNLLTEKSKRQWQDYIRNSAADTETHDTVTVLVQDSDGRISGACSTSGMAYKLPGRVGDSPIIGAGLYVDNDIGAAGATGVGEEVIRVCGSFLIVELMRQGYLPDEACEEACRRTMKRYPQGKPPSVSYIALRKDGKAGAANIANRFEYALYANEIHRLISVPKM